MTPDPSAPTMGSSSLLDESVTWAEFGKQHLDRRVSKAITSTLALERPTLVQSRGIPVALQGRDLLCRARTGSGKTLCYGVPLVQRLLADAEAASGIVPPLRGVVLVPTKELIVQVHGVISSLLTFCFEVLTVEPLLSGQKYLKAELPSILVTTPSSLVALLKQRQPAIRPLAETLKVLIVDEADLMFSFGYESDMKALCAMMPSTYQAVLVSATLSEEVEQMRGLMLHKPVVLKLEEPRVTGKLSQFYFPCHKEDKYLILYTLLKLQLVQGKTLMFVRSVEEAYRMRIFLERFSINSAVMNSELPHASRQNIIQAFNGGVVDLLIATDEGLKKDFNADEGEDDVEVHDADAEDGDAPPKKKKLKVDAAGGGEKVASKFGRKKRPEADGQYSLTRGVDLKDVSTVINADMPTTVRDYVHRVGRCARGGASGTALTLCTEAEEEQLQAIIQQQSSANPLKPLPMQISDAERFRYRVEDMARGLTKKAISQYRARELQLEALNSEKLKEYFEEHPEEKRALQRTQRALKEKRSIRAHLKHVPAYLVPEHFTAAATPVQQAAREEAMNAGMGQSASAKRRKMQMVKKQDPLHGFSAHTPGAGGKKKRSQMYTREMFEAKERRIDPKTANVEDLPPLSGRKIWKLKHGKRVRRKTDQLGERKRMTYGQKKRLKKGMSLT